MEETYKAQVWFYTGNGFVTVSEHEDFLAAQREVFRYRSDSKGLRILDPAGNVVWDSKGL